MGQRDQRASSPRLAPPGFGPPRGGVRPGSGCPAGRSPGTRRGRPDGHPTLSRSGRGIPQSPGTSSGPSWRRPSARMNTSGWWPPASPGRRSPASGTSTDSAGRTCPSRTGRSRFAPPRARLRRQLLYPSLLEDLRELRDHHRAYLGLGWRGDPQGRPEDLVFRKDDRRTERSKRVAFREWFAYRLQKYARAVGYREHVFPHLLRSSAATDLSERGASDRDIMDRAPGRPWPACSTTSGWTRRPVASGYGRAWTCESGGPGLSTSPFSRG